MPFIVGGAGGDPKMKGKAGGAFVLRIPIAVADTSPMQPKYLAFSLLKKSLCMLWKSKRAKFFDGPSLTACAS